MSGFHPQPTFGANIKGFAPLARVSKINSLAGAEVRCGRSAIGRKKIIQQGRW
jgi:hypothetical protein